MRIALVQGIMGTWNESVFGNDLASDIRGEYRDLLGQGLTGQEATDKLLQDYASALSGEEEAPVFWTALAATQWKCGRLEQRVKEKALFYIDSGADLVQWEVEKQRAKRQRVLVALREQLVSPQPKATTIRKRKLATCDWKPGEVIQYRLASGEYSVFRVDHLNTDKGGTYPSCMLLDYFATEPPSGGKVQSLNCVRRTGFDHLRRPCATWIDFILCDAGRLPMDRVSRTGIQQVRPIRHGNSESTVLIPRVFDRWLHKTFKSA